MIRPGNPDVGHVGTAVSAERLRSSLAALPGPRSRLHSPEALAEAERQLTECWRENGWAVSSHPFRLENTDGIEDFDDFSRTTYEELRGVNHVAVLPGRSERALVIGAHLDTVRDSPGACDNGAAIAAVMELSRVLAPLSLRRTLILAAFDLEEIGVLGSPELVRELRESRPIDGAIILESIGYTVDEPRAQRIPFGFGMLFPRQTLRIRRRRRRADWTAAIYRGSASAIMAQLDLAARRIAGPHALLAFRDPLDRPVSGPILGKVLPVLGNLARSDHAAFWRAGIPAVQLTDTANFRSDHYHAESDTVDTIDFEHLRRITAAVATAVVALDAEVTA